MAFKIQTLSPVTVTNAGTAVQVNPTTLSVTSLLIEADPANVGNIYVGDSTVTSSNGMAVAPGYAVEIDGDQRRGGGFDMFDASLWYVNSSGSGNIARIFAFIRQ